MIKAFRKLIAFGPFFKEELFELLDAFDGPFHIIEQSIIGDVKATYKKINPFIKWMFVNIENQLRPNQTEDYQWSTYE